MSVRITSGGKEVIDSGSVASFDSNPILIELQDYGIGFEVQFIENPDIPEIKITSGVKDERTLSYQVINSRKSQLGFGWTTPREIAFTTENKIKRPIFLNIRVDCMPQGDYLLSYTLYKGGGTVGT